MTNTTHTPGPWETEYVSEADVWGIWQEKPPENETGSIARAYDESNARLIAAAPELLEALKYWLPVIEAQEGKSDEKDQWVDCVRFAIAKAEGK